MSQLIHKQKGLFMRQNDANNYITELCAKDVVEAPR